LIPGLGGKSEGDAQPARGLDKPLPSRSLLWPRRRSAKAERKAAVGGAAGTPAGCPTAVRAGHAVCLRKRRASALPPVGAPGFATHVQAVIRARKNTCARSPERLVAGRLERRLVHWLPKFAVGHLRLRGGARFVTPASDSARAASREGTGLRWNRCRERRTITRPR